MIQPENDSRWFPDDDRLTAGLKLFVLFLVCELAVFIICFLIPVYIHRMNPLTMAVPLIAGTMLTAILFALKYQVDNSRDGTGRGGTPILILFLGFLINIGAFGFAVLGKIVDPGVLKLPGQVLVLVILIPFIAFMGLLLYYVVLTEGWERKTNEKE